MKKTFEKPVVDIVKLSNIDIVCESIPECKGVGTVITDEDPC